MCMRGVIYLKWDFFSGMILKYTLILFRTNMTDITLDDDQLQNVADFILNYSYKYFSLWMVLSIFGSIIRSSYKTTYNLEHRDDVFARTLFSFIFFGASIYLTMQSVSVWRFKFESYIFCLLSCTLSAWSLIEFSMDSDILPNKGVGIVLMILGGLLNTWSLYLIRYKLWETLAVYSLIFSYNIWINGTVMMAVIYFS